MEHSQKVALLMGALFVVVCYFAVDAGTTIIVNEHMMSKNGIDAIAHQETSSFLKTAYMGFGLWGFIAAKAAITFTIIALAWFVAFYENRLFYSSCLLMIGVSALGLYAGLSNLNVINTGYSYDFPVIGNAMLYMALLLGPIVLGFIVSYAPDVHAIQKIGLYKARHYDDNKR